MFNFIQKIKCYFSYHSYIRLFHYSFGGNIILCSDCYHTKENLPVWFQYRSFIDDSIITEEEFKKLHVGMWKKEKEKEKIMEKHPNIFDEKLKSLIRKNMKASEELKKTLYNMRKL